MVTSVQNISLVVGILALLLALYGLWQNRNLNRLKNTFFAGKSGIDLESVILSLKEQLGEGQRHQQQLEEVQKNIQDNLGFAVQKVGLVRFNPFAGSGGNFSFSLALLDNHNNGVVITSMYGREQNRIYAKKITDGVSDSQLTAEELEALNMSDVKVKNVKAKTKRQTINS